MAAELRFNVDDVDLAGGAFGRATNRVFLIEMNGENPIVHVLRIDRSSSP